jgi:hypothetical protein
MKKQGVLMVAITFSVFAQADIKAQRQSEKQGKIEKVERPNKVDKANRLDKSNKADKVDRPTKTEKIGQSNRINSVDRRNKVANAKTVVVVRPPRVYYPRNQFPRTKVVVVRPRVRTITVLAPEHTRIVYRGRPYFYQGGRYFHYVNNGYTIIAPPRGIRLGFLPIGYRPIFIGNVQHYYYRGAYYRPIGSEYEVFEPNVGTIVPDLPEDNVEEVTIDGQVYYECNDILYKSVSTANGSEYEVVGKLND